MAVAVSGSGPIRPKPIPLLSFAPEGGGDTHREDVSEKVFEYWKHAQTEVDPNHFRLPRLVVRDHVGRKIDIYSSYQEKIYAAKKNVRETGEARTPEEWRLPHGLLPSKPDYTRRAPPGANKKEAKQEPVAENPVYRQQPFTVDVEDVSFVAESLRCLPDVASLSYLRHEFLAGNKLFLPILKACMLHQRVLSALDRRVQQYQSPDLCTGCIRSGLCYGCDKRSLPHYHLDKMAKTGGGFTYYKRDRPGHIMEKKDPRNWKTRFQEEFDRLAREIAGTSKLYDVTGKQESPKVLSLIPDFSVEFPQQVTPDLASESGRGSADGKSSGEDVDDNQSASETNDLQEKDQEASSRPLENAENGQSAGEESRMNNSTIEPNVGLDSHKNGLQGFGPQVTGFQGWVNDEEDEDHQKGSNSDVETDTNTKHYYYQQGITKLDDLIGFGKKGLEGAGIPVPKNKKESTRDGENAMATHLSRDYSDNSGTDGKTSESLGSQNKGRKLYKAPPAFKVKPREKREITAKNPFSTNRELNVPQGEGFTIKKSDKKLTEFKEFDSADKTWKEPKKFELKENSKKTTSFWQAPVKEERKPKQTRKVSRQRAAPQPPPVPENPVLSSDSGLESEQFTAWVRQIISASEQECQIEAEYGELFEYPVRWLKAIYRHGYWPPSEPQGVFLQGGELMSGDELEETGSSTQSSGSGHQGGFHGFLLDDNDTDSRKTSASAVEGNSDIVADKNSGSSSDKIWVSRKSSLRSNFSDTSNSTASAPSCVSSQVPMTSPDLDLSLADIGEEILPLTYVNPVELPDVKKLRRKMRKKRSKRLVSEEQIETQADAENEEKKEHEETDILNTDKNQRKLSITKSSFSPFVRSSDKYRSAVQSGSASLDDSVKENFKAMLCAGAKEDGESLVSNNFSEIMITVDSPESSSVNPEGSSEGKSSASFDEVQLDSTKRPTAHPKSGFRTKSKLAFKKDKSKKPVIKSPERVFGGMDDELMKKLPSIQHQLAKLGISVDTSNFEKSSEKEWADNQDSLKSPRQNVLDFGFIGVNGRPLSGREATSEEKTTDEQETLPSLSKESGKLLPMLLTSEPLTEVCTMCGASLDETAFHICLPPLSSRMKPKKAKAALPRRVRHTRVQRRIPVEGIRKWKKNQQVVKEKPSKTKDFKDEGITDDTNLLLQKNETEKEDEKKIEPGLTGVPVEIRKSRSRIMSFSSELSTGSLKSRRSCPRDSTQGEETKPPTPEVSLAPAPPAKPKRERLKKKKQGIVRKEKSPTPPKLPEIKPVSPPSQVEHTSPTLTPPTPRAELSPLPPIPTFTVPELPDFVFPESPKPRSPRLRKMIESPMPVPVKENKKTRKPPPKPRRQVKVKHAKRSVAEAPVTKEELQQASDPLDFLAKYCIIHAERLPLYQKIFDKSVSNQTPRYPMDGSLPGTHRENQTDSLTPRDITLQLDTHVEGATPRGFNPQFSPHEMKMLHDLTVINRSPEVVNVATSHAEDYLEKLKFSFEVVHDKQLNLQKQVKELQDRRVSIMAAKAKEMFPEIMSPRSTSKSKKKTKKSGKKSALSVQSKDVVFSENSSPVNGMPPPKSAASLKPELMSDVAIVEKLSNKMFDAVRKSAEVCRVEVELERAEEKLQNVIGRMEELQGETALMQIYCMEYFLQSETQMIRPKEFVRQQSTMYNALHPARDVELNLTEVGQALQTINNNLLTDKELDYLFHILNLPGRTRINFQLFSVLAALSERVAQLDPLIKKLINKLDYEALDVKMEKCKELFALLHEGDYLPGGRASASLLAVELTAGGLTPEHTAYVLSKFNRDGTGIVDFMDFVTYVPLFIQIHQRIVDDPLRVELDI